LQLCSIVLIISETISRKILSLILICIFAFSITPAITIHNLFSAHTDREIQHHHKHISEIAAAGFNCHLDNFVSNSNFINFFTPLTFELLNNSPVSLIVKDQTFFSQHHFYAELRGPPSKGLVITSV